MKKIKRALRRVRHNLARAVLGLVVADRRIRHHKKRLHNAVERGDGVTATRAKKYLRRWQKRQTKMRDRHVYLQTVLDRRLRRKVKWLKDHPEPVSPHGLISFDGKQGAAWIVAILIKARATGLWHGYMISGWRSRSYSRSLCEHMCGAPTCPGRCAGEYTNHVGEEFPEGAADVTDSDGLDAALAELGETRLRNDLPLDAPHYSNSGH